MNSKIFTRINKVISMFPTGLRMKIYRCFSQGGIAQDAYIAPNCEIDNPRNLIIESGANINRFCRFMTGDDKNAIVTLGKNTYVGCNVSFICITHEIGQHNKRAGTPLFRPITIGSGVLSFPALILPMDALLLPELL